MSTMMPDVKTIITNVQREEHEKLVSMYSNCYYFVGSWFQIKEYRWANWFLDDPSSDTAEYAFTILNDPVYYKAPKIILMNGSEIELPQDPKVYGIEIDKDTIIFIIEEIIQPQDENNAETGINFFDDYTIVRRENDKWALVSQHEHTKDRYTEEIMYGLYVAPFLFSGAGAVWVCVKEVQTEVYESFFPIPTIEAAVPTQCVETCHRQNDLLVTKCCCLLEGMFTRDPNPYKIADRPLFLQRILEKTVYEK